MLKILEKWQQIKQNKKQRDSRNRMITPYLIAPCAPNLANVIPISNMEWKVYLDFKILDLVEMDSVFGAG